MLSIALRKSAQILSIQNNTASSDNSSQETSISKPADLQDPFKKDCIDKVMLWYEPETFGKGWRAIGYIYFSLGKTSGKQEFKASTIEQLLEDMAQFVSTL